MTVGRNPSTPSAAIASQADRKPFRGEVVTVEVDARVAVDLQVEESRASHRA